MTPLCAKDSLSNRVIRVDAESRPRDVQPDVQASRATHAVVFEEEHFRGVVRLQEVGFSQPERIFVDLIPCARQPTVSIETSVEEIARIIEEKQCDSVVVLDANGKYAGIVTQQSLLEVLLEQTRILSHERVRKAEEGFRGLLEATPDATIIVNAYGQIVQANASTFEMFGFEHNELLGEVVENLISERLRERHVEHRNRYFVNPVNRPMGVGLELTAVQKDGSEFPVEVSLNPLKGEHDGYVVAAIRDVTARRHAEQEMKCFRAAIDISGDAVVLIDRNDMCFVDVNDTACAILGYSRDELLRLGPQDVKPQYTKRELERRFDEVIQGRADQGVLEIVHQRRDGTQFPAEVSIRALRRHDKDFLIAVIRDITHRKQREEELQASHRQLEMTLAELKQTQQQAIQQERLRALGQMASGIAHDLNNTLSPILGYSEIIMGAPDLPDRLRKMAHLVVTGARDAAVVVERLRSFYGPQDRLDASRGAVNLTELLPQIRELTRPKWRDDAQRTGRTVQFELDLVDECKVRGTAVELREVLTNLVFNAVDSIPSSGKIILRLHVTPDSGVIEMIDTGIGMTEEVVKRCFEPFFTTKGSDGTGLGLSVCHGIVCRHGGRIEIDTEPGRGTTMRIFLPLVDQLGLTEPEQPIADALPSCRILYIDDDSRLRHVVATLLEQLGQQVDLAESGAEGLEKFRANRYDVVVTDLGMPGINGCEVTRIIKETRQNMPVIMVTGWGSPERQERSGSGVEPDLMLSKPITLAKLRDALAKGFA